MTFRAIYRALALRELRPRPLGFFLLLCIAVGAAGGVIAGRFDHRGSGAVMLIVELDRTLAAVLAIVAMFRAISRLAADAAAEWLLQLCAAGCTRWDYSAALLIAVSLPLLAGYAAGVWAFAGVVAVTGGGYTAAMRGFMTLPLVAMIIFASASCGAVIFQLAGVQGARTTAGALIAAPWIMAWMGAVTGGDLPPVWLARIVSLSSPPLSVGLSFHPAARVLLYAGVSFALVLTCSGRRIARL